MAKKIPRRHFWKSLFTAIRPEMESPKRRPPPKRGRGVHPGSSLPPSDLPPIPLRPPGALGEWDFRKVCQHCGACREACEPGILLRLGEAYGESEGSPGFFPETGPCELCEDLPCAEACPSGALQPPAHWSSAAMGTAVLEPQLCLDLQGTHCDHCALACPTELRAIELTEHGPRIFPERCTGCGLCVATCPAEPKALRVQPGLSSFALSPA
jgi:ferredoxin-type protein NapG